ncbi:hypothetical protein RHSIM_Rhsim12G0067500 [Rhododendron simsii]|uniref:F-box domain-containing protein n=1 Tax=Rhododendron simsii TaxID=118357 RepID=A0A834G2J9_RHOSS|nr:hypothetical protein RHSIM_Rhsim12G0067500 [Rhododendron simsii]
MCDSTSDIISHVPGNILDKILMCLPLQDAVRTSILSRKWRYAWVKLPQLLYDVVIADDVLSSLISNCPLLEDLTLHTSLRSLEVVGPNLKFVCCVGHFRSICFKNTSRLTNVGIYLDALSKDIFRKQERSSSVMLLESVPGIESLGLDFCYVKGIAASGVPTRLPTTLNNLKDIKLYYICFGERDEVSVLLCLIRSSPNLEKITIEAFPGATSAIPIDLDFSEVHGCLDVSLNQLRKVDMENVSGTKPELEFIKFLLAKSPMLDTMLIKLKSVSVADELRIVKELTRLRRASPQAEMNFGS